MTDRSKVLVLFADEDQQKVFNKLKDYKTSLPQVVFKTSNFDQFSDSKMIDKFDFVIAFVQPQSDDDLEMQSDFWKHYGVAPVIAVLHNNATPEWIRNNISQTSILIKSENEENYSADLINAVQQCQESYQKIFTSDVKPSFESFD